jgi:hypothetical protein
VCHLCRTQRSFNPIEASLERLTDVYRLTEIEEEKRTSEYPEKLVSITNVRRVIENLNSYLRQNLGTQGVPLAYIVRTESIPPLEAADLPFGIPMYNDGYD